MYEYNCKLVSVYDGDTVVVDIDLGFDVWLRNQHVRIEGIDTPEIKSKDAEEKALGLEAKNLLFVLLSTASEIRLICSKYDSTEKYGRILGDLFVPPKNAQSIGSLTQVAWVSMRDELLAYQRGKPYDGGPR